MTPALIAAATLPDSITFVIAAVIVVAGALGVVLMKNPVHSALMLVMTLFGIAVLFVEQDAQFLAAVQVIVYTGAVVVLFLFVIMLLGVDRKEVVFAETFKGQRLFASFVGLCVLAEVIFLGSRNWTTGAPSVQGAVANNGANITIIGDSLFTTYLLPFEITSALLVVAVIAAVVLGRRHDAPVIELDEDNEEVSP
jgi:NADH-quinone oxidoreductase subunit J